MSNGFKAYLVGGCLRDMLLGRTAHDWDIASSAASEDVLRLFPKTVRTGDRFGTVTVVTGGGMVEVTTFRSENGYSDRRRPDSVTFVSDLEKT
jgi:tRNA nucleotidyltransferase (CCA-adding enzyme)